MSPRAQLVIVSNILNLVLLVELEIITNELEQLQILIHTDIRDAASVTFS